MDRRLRVLIVEDSEDDTRLLLRELRRGGYEPSFERVDTAEAMDEAMERRSWDVVIADYVMPSFSGMAALELLKKKGIDLPFILVSGQIDEETVVAAIKAGAGGFVSKGNLGRLVPAVERELRDAQVRRQRREAEEALQKAYAELELRVKERTAGLKEANSNLRVEIAERKKAEEEIQRLLESEREAREEAQRSSHRLETILATVPVGVLVVDVKGEFVNANHEARAIFGDGPTGTAASPAGRSEVLRPDGSPLSGAELPLTRALERGERVKDEEVLIRREDGETLAVLASAVPVRDGSGSIVGAVATLLDITPLRDLEQQREEFISVVAHDLRNALTSIKGFAQILTGPSFKDKLPPAAQQPLERIASGTQRIDRMISDLLDVSRIEARRLTLKKKLIDPLTLVRDIVQRTGEFAKGHPMKVEVRGDVPQLAADPDRIEQVLTNLLSNAGKYSDPDTEITVEVERRANEVMVSVTNLGRGILPEDQEKLFTRFHRTRQAQEEKVPGLGLGLYIAKGLVEAHGGRIWVESRPGKYATFRFTLPIEGPIAKFES